MFGKYIFGRACALCHVTDEKAGDEGGHQSAQDKCEELFSHLFL